MNEQITLSTSLQFIADPGHGWLRVPLSDLATLGIEQEISPYSYVNQGYAYLEEDCDYSVYMEAYRKTTGTEPAIHDKYERRFAGRDRYGMYLPPVVTDEWLRRNHISEIWWDDLKARARHNRC